MNTVLRRVTGYELTRYTPPGPAPEIRGPQSGDRLVTDPIFLMAPVRSGSTLLRVLLNGHSRLHAPQELHLRHLQVTARTADARRSMEILGLNVADLEHVLWDRLLHRELVRSGKDFIVEKTPGHALLWQRIATCWPDARYLFLLRDPTAIAYSWYDADPKKRTLEGSVAKTLRYMQAVEAARQTLPGHTVRYEELTKDPVGVLKGVCDYLDIDMEPGLAEYGLPADGLVRGLGDWRSKVRSGQVQAPRALPADLLTPKELEPFCTAWGYPTHPRT